jgi:hypothetical protein
MAADLEGLQRPDFISEKTVWKIVSSARLTHELDYHFENPSPMDWLRSL